MLGFWTRSYTLWVDPFTIDDDAVYKTKSRDQLDGAVFHALQADLNPDSGTYQIRQESDAESIGQRVLHRGWRGRHMDAFEFALISTNRKHANLLLLEWDGGIARRVGIVRAVKLEALNELTILG
jgi:hypothetical protein